MTIGTRRRRYLIALPTIAVSLLLVSCGDGASSNSSQEPVAQGEAIYKQSCASCHGSDLRGTDRGPSHLSQVYEPGHHPDASFRSAIENGAPAHHWDFGDMAPVRQLDDAEIDAVISYIREQQVEHGFESYPPD